MYFRLLISIVFMIFLMFFFNTSIGQVLNCQVNVSMEHLQPQDREDLSTLQQKLTDYLNNKNWSDENKDIVLNCNVQLIIETVTNRGPEKIYRAQFLISSPSGENYYDRSCEFVYVPGQAFEEFRSTFDPLLALVDYYANLVIAGELDTYELFAGTSFYDRAQNIANQGQLSIYPMGWRNRTERAIQNTDGDHVELREAKFYYYEGLYFIEEEPTPDTARKFAKAVVERLVNVHSKRPSSEALKRFFDSHFQEICKLFKYDTDRSNVNVMLEIDALHRDTYLNCEISG
jgi:hypothetical protein